MAKLRANLQMCVIAELYAAHPDHRNNGESILIQASKHPERKFLYYMKERAVCLRNMQFSLILEIIILSVIKREKRTYSKIVRFSDLEKKEERAACSIRKNWLRKSAHGMTLWM